MRTTKSITFRAERGSAAIIVALSLFAVMGIATIAIDGGILQNARREDQNAADHAALAAAWEFCHGGNPEAAGLISAERNGFDNNGTTNTVTITPVQTGRYKAEVRSERGSAFSSTVGVTTLGAVASAVAECVSTAGPAGGFTIFANGNCTPKGDPAKTVDWSGSNTIVEGAVHSNLDIYIGGANNAINGATTYVDELTPPPPGGSTVIYGEEPEQTTPKGDPFAALYRIEDYVPGGAKAQAAGSNYFDFTGSKIDSGALENYHDPVSGLPRPLLTGTQLADGLYFTDEDIDIGTSGLTGKVTFVTSAASDDDKGQLTVSGSLQNLENYDADGLLFFSDFDGPCGEYGVKSAGSASRWRGNIYAPRALVEMSGSGSENSRLDGSLVGDEVRLNGSGLDLHHAEFGGGDQTFHLELLK
jgi:Flp pilus assembly protein TadG